MLKTNNEFNQKCLKNANEGLFYYLNKEGANLDATSFLKSNQKPTLSEVEGCFGGRDFTKIEKVSKLYVESPVQVFDMDISVLSPSFASSHGFEAILMSLEKQKQLETVFGFEPGKKSNILRLRKALAGKIKELNLIKNPEKSEQMISLLNSKQPIWLNWNWLKLLSLSFNLHFQLFSLSNKEKQEGVFIPHITPLASAVYESDDISAYVRLGHVCSFVGKQYRHLFVGIHLPQFDEA